MALGRLKRHWKHAFHLLRLGLQDGGKYSYPGVKYVSSRAPNGGLDVGLGRCVWLSLTLERSLRLSLSGPKHAFAWTRRTPCKLMRRSFMPRSAAAKAQDPDPARGGLSVMLSGVCVRDLLE